MMTRFKKCCKNENGKGLLTCIATGNRVICDVHVVSTIVDHRGHELVMSFETLYVMNFSFETICVI